MYRRRKRAARKRRLLLAAALLCISVGLMIWLGRSPRLKAELLQDATPTPVTADYDHTMETREITLAEARWYTIQTGVFSSQEAALEKAEAYTERGAPGTVVQEGSKWRVFIASYGSEEDASAVRQRLGEQQRVETYLHCWTCPELRLRLTGMAGQLDVVEAGFSLMLDSAVRLRDTATLLDAGQLTTAEAAAAAGDIDGQISLWMETARSRFGRQAPALVQQLQSFMEAWTPRRKALNAAADSATNLSAALKQQAMGLYSDVIRFRTAVLAE